MARPLKLAPDEKTLQTLEGLGKIQATTKEAAAVLGVSEPTFIGFLKRYKKAKETFEYAKEAGKTSVRRAQMKAALGGNATMLVWLGKQLLDQKDKSELTGKDGKDLIPDDKPRDNLELARWMALVLTKAGREVDNQDTKE